MQRPLPTIQDMTGANSMSDNAVHILLIEDEAAHAELVARAFELRGGDVRNVALLRWPNAFKMAKSRTWPS